MLSVANTKHGRYSKAAKDKRKEEIEARRVAKAVHKAEMKAIRAERMLLEKAQHQDQGRQKRSDPKPAWVVGPSAPDVNSLF
jgi:hypothetical protein